jgi:hypothetical protein
MELILSTTSLKSTAFARKKDKLIKNMNMVVCNDRTERTLVFYQNNSSDKNLRQFGVSRLFKT